MEDSILTIAVSVSAGLAVQIIAVLGSWNYIKAEIKAATERSLHNKSLITRMEEQLKTQKDWHEEDRAIQNASLNEMKQDIRGINATINEMNFYLRNNIRDEKNS